MAVNYEDERFGKVEADKQQAMTELEQVYSGVIDGSDDFYQAQIDASKQWADKQSQLQQEQTDFTIEQIEQQKDKAQKDYTKEQSGAYVDWRKQSNEYGTEAEQMASAGLATTGFSESSQVSMYNTYQNRVATARESFAQAVLNYDNAIKDARLQNNAALAEIAYTALQQQLELSLQGFQYKNQLVLEQANKKVELDNAYYNRYLDVLNQINTENAMAEEIRQYNQNYELSVKQFNEEIRQFNQSYDLQLKEYNEGIRQFNEEIARLKKKDEREYKMQIQELELKKKQMAEEKRQWEAEMAFKKQQYADQQKALSASYSAPVYNPTKDDDTPKGGNDVTPTAFNPKSVLNLGLGPISDARVAELEAAGAVTTTKQGNQLYVQKTPAFDAYKNTSSKTNNILPGVSPTQMLTMTGTTTSTSPRKSTNPIASKFPWLN